MDHIVGFVLTLIRFGIMGLCLTLFVGLLHAFANSIHR